MSDLSLDSLRQTIDEIDDQLHDLLMRRVDVVAPMAALKAEDPGRDFVRPAREAHILRRLIARHGGVLPVEVVIRLWRELMAANLIHQGDFSVHVFGGNPAEGTVDLAVWDLARAYYGSCTTMALQPTPQKLIQVISETRGALGIMPVPAQQDDDAPWWQVLLAEDTEVPRIIARIPFIDGDGVEMRYPPAYVLGCVEPAATGEDTTVIALVTDHEISRARVQSGLEALNLSVHVMASRDEAGANPSRHYLCEAAGFHHGAEEDLLAKLDSTALGIRRLVTLGAFASPSVIGASS